jgi:hypothetical protein
MTAEIINLRKARKARQRLQAQDRAAENRAKFGRMKAERKAGDARRDLAERRLDGAHRQSDGDEPDR